METGRPKKPLPPKKRTVNARLREEIFEDLKRHVVYDNGARKFTALPVSRPQAYLPLEVCR